MQLVAVGEPHPDPHRRVQRPIGQQAARLEAQPQVVRAELATAGHGQLVLACAQQLSTAPWNPRDGVLSGMLGPSGRFT